ncbi:unnamed protein product [Cuscuta campestris]|uniref:Major facilitator superfamily (MFS) profile domain-containing protein n=1 Tax=Cuscuta campestris TaxID=132261 RepID=A0A484KL73_9ASTE|nr:unnamed protein product [Cuscuta campestris]
MIMVENRSYFWLYRRRSYLTADVIDESNRFAVFSWMTGLFSASRVLGDALARVLPESIIFQVSLGLLIFVPVYMALFLVETIKPTSRADQSFPQVNKAKRILWERYESMRSAARIVLSSPTLKCVILISFSSWEFPALMRSCW